jgi:hypothetical protein
MIPFYLRLELTGYLAARMAATRVEISNSKVDIAALAATAENLVWLLLYTT